MREIVVVLFDLVKNFQIIYLFISYFMREKNLLLLALNYSNHYFIKNKLFEILLKKSKY